MELGRHRNHGKTSVTSFKNTYSKQAQLQHHHDHRLEQASANMISRPIGAGASGGGAATTTHLYQHPSQKLSPSTEDSSDDSSSYTSAFTDDDESSNLDDSTTSEADSEQRPKNNVAASNNFGNLRRDTLTFARGKATQGQGQLLQRPSGVGVMQQGAHGAGAAALAKFGGGAPVSILKRTTPPRAPLLNSSAEKQRPSGPGVGPVPAPGGGSYRRTRTSNVKQPPWPSASSKRLLGSPDIHLLKQQAASIHNLHRNSPMLRAAAAGGGGSSAGTMRSGGGGKVNMGARNRIVVILSCIAVVCLVTLGVLIRQQSHDPVGASSPPALPLQPNQNNGQLDAPYQDSYQNGAAYGYGANQQPAGNSNYFLRNSGSANIYGSPPSGSGGGALLPGTGSAAGGAPRGGGGGVSGVGGIFGSVFSSISTLWYGVAAALALTMALFLLWWVVL